MHELKNYQGVTQVKGYSEAGASLIKRAFKGFTAQSGSPREDIDFQNQTLRERGRILTMSSPVAASAIGTNRTKIVGSGLTLQCAVDREILGISAEAAKAWQQRTESEFQMWSSKAVNVDALAINNFEDLQQLALRSWLASGDVFAVLKRYEATRFNPYTLRIHLVEADRVATPDDSMTLGAMMTDGVNKANGNRIFDGVEIDRNGMVVAYHIRNTYPYEITMEQTKWTRVEVRGGKTGLPNILHIMSSERPDQYRGVTYLAPVIEQLLQLRRYTESELMAALIQSFFTAWIQTETDTGEIPTNEVGAGNIEGIRQSGAVREVSQSPNEYEMVPGTVTHLKKGEKIEFGNPNIPTAGFDTFVRAIYREIGAGLELPYDVLIKEFNSSYSAARGALLEAWEAFRMRRKWFIDDFCQPVYETWLTEAVVRGRIKAPGFFDDPLVHAAWSQARWVGPVAGSIDPLKEAKAAVIMANKGFKTHGQITRELGGGDWDENVETLTHEISRLIAAGAIDITAIMEDGDDGEKTD